MCIEEHNLVDSTTKMLLHAPIFCSIVCNPLVIIIIIIIIILIIIIIIIIIITITITIIIIIMIVNFLFSIEKEGKTIIGNTITT